jgi:acetate kinase
MGVETDQEILQLVGTETLIENGLVASLQECSSLGINSCYQALDYIGSRVVASKRQYSTTEVLKYELSTPLHSTPLHADASELLLLPR